MRLRSMAGLAVPLLETIGQGWRDNLPGQRCRSFLGGCLGRLRRLPGRFATMIVAETRTAWAGLQAREQGGLADPLIH
jgi:hypothetical protein